MCAYLCVRAYVWSCVCLCAYVGLARTIYIRCIYGIFGRENTQSTVIYGVYIYGPGQPYAYAYVCAARVCSCIPMFVCKFWNLWCMRAFDGPARAERAKNCLTQGLVDTPRISVSCRFQKSKSIFQCWSTWYVALTETLVSSKKTQCRKPMSVGSREWLYSMFSEILMELLSIKT